MSDIKFLAMNSSFTPFRRPWDNGLAWVVILLGSVTLAGLPAVMALSLGDLAVESHLGRPFSATVQLLNSSGEERRGECRKEILPVPRVPYLIRPRIRLEKRDGKSSLRITTSAPIGEPVVGLSVRLDCDQPKGT
ncbi:MAG: hypothetical protein GY731_08860, partial [Gammaproteobacteria bacterium]|nr:hypothetical protein [Gammaproteobacteria bacterium]